RADGEVHFRLAKPGEIPRAGDPDAELARDEGVPAVGIGGQRDFVLGVDGSPELRDLDGRGLRQRGALEVGRVDVRAVLPEEVLEAPRVLPRVHGADGESEGVALCDLL